MIGKSLLKRYPDLDDRFGLPATVPLRSFCMSPTNNAKGGLTMKHTSRLTSKDEAVAALLFTS